MRLKRSSLFRTVALTCLRAEHRYSTTSVYTELRDGTDGDDGTRLLTIENHLGVPVRVTLEDKPSSSEEAARDKGRPFRLKKTG